jgi:hypothetical protein
METLINKFNKVSNDSKDCAILCHQLLVEFGCYYRIVLDAYDGEPIGTMEELVNQFIKENYGKQ